MKNNIPYEKHEETAEFLKNSGFKNPKYAVITGSGLGSTKGLTILKSIPYREIPNFPLATVAGHEGKLLYGKSGNTYFVAQQGRFHYYEGYTGSEIVFALRVMKMLGAETLLVSNAAGGVNTDYKVGDLMLISDHINMLPNPLIGPNEERFGVRFPDMTHVWDKDLIAEAEKQLNKDADISFHKGVYFASSGPSFETPAEYKFMRTIGADAVGMSTTPEAIAAAHAGMKLFGVSVITNAAYGFTDDFKNDGADVIKAAKKAAEKISRLFAYIIANKKT